MFVASLSVIRVSMCFNRKLAFYIYHASTCQIKCKQDEDNKSRNEFPMQWHSPHSQSNYCRDYGQSTQIYITGVDLYWSDCFFFVYTTPETKTYGCILEQKCANIFVCFYFINSSVLFVCLPSMESNCIKSWTICTKSIGVINFKLFLLNYSGW